MRYSGSWGLAYGPTVVAEETCLSEALEDIKWRCEATGIEYDDEYSLTIYFPLPWSEETYPQFVEGYGSHAERVAQERSN